MNKRGCVLVLFAMVCVGCRRDMQTQPKYTPLSRSWFYADGRSARPSPQGTIPFGESTVDTALTTGRVNGAFLTTIPVPITVALLHRGRTRFDIFCSPCHGHTGNGEGMVARQGLKQPADLNGARVRNAPPGYIYQVIVNGYGAMDDYAYQIKNVRDRWAIVAYLRALELSRRASLGDVPADQRAVLEARR